LVIDDIGGGTGGDQEISVRSKTINTSTLPHFVLSHFKGSLADWSEVVFIDIRKINFDALRTAKYLCLVQLGKKKFQLALYPTSHSNLRVFKNMSGGGGINRKSIEEQSESQSENIKQYIRDIAEKNAAIGAYYNGELKPYRPHVASFEPGVLISKPKNGIVITRSLRGIGIEGSSVNANNVEISWKGDEVGNESLSSNEEWTGDLPVRTGKYTLTATVSGGICHSVSFSVILKPAITVYAAEDI